MTSLYLCHAVLVGIMPQILSAFGGREVHRGKTFRSWESWEGLLESVHAVCPKGTKMTHISPTCIIYSPFPRSPRTSSQYSIYWNSQISTSRSGQGMEAILQGNSSWSVVVRVKWTPHHPCFLVFLPLCTLPFLSMSQTHNLLLNNKMWQRWWDFVTEIVLPDKRLTGWLTCSGDFLSLLCFKREEAMSRDLCDRILRAAFEQQVAWSQSSQGDELCQQSDYDSVEPLD